MKILLEYGADAHLRNLKDRDTLAMATLYGFRSKDLNSIIKMLLFYEVEIDFMDASGAAPLHECAIRNLCKPMKLLLESGANVNLPHKRNGLTALQILCSSANPDVEAVRSLLEFGAQPNAKDSRGQNAYDRIFAAHNKNVSTSTFILF